MHHPQRTNSAAESNSFLCAPVAESANVVSSLVGFPRIICLVFPDHLLLTGFLPASKPANALTAGEPINGRWSAETDQRRDAETFL